MKQVSLVEAAKLLPDLIAAADHGEEVVIVGDAHQHLAKIVSLSSPPRRRVAGLARGTIWMAPDFDEPLEDFREHME